MAEPKLEKVTLNSAVKHNNTWYQPGDTFEADTKTVAELRAAGAVRDPQAEAPVSNDAVDAAEQEAQDIIAKAEADAETIVKTAEDSAADIIAKAEERLKNAKDEADRIVAEAQKPADTAETASEPAPAATQAKTATKSK